MMNVSNTLYRFASRNFSDEHLVKSAESLALTISLMIDDQLIHADIYDLVERLYGTAENVRELRAGCGLEEAREELACLNFEGMHVLTDVTSVLPDLNTVEIRPEVVEVLGLPNKEREDQSRITPARFSARWTWADFNRLIDDYETVYPDREAEVKALRDRIILASEDKRDEILVSLNRTLAYPLGYFE